jgi:hypothetical protein
MLAVNKSQNDKKINDRQKMMGSEFFLEFNNVDLIIKNCKSAKLTKQSNPNSTSMEIR